MDKQGKQMPLMIAGHDPRRAAGAAAAATPGRP
jgi:hypothetical protein